LRNRLWVATGANEVKVLSNIYGGPADSPVNIISSFSDNRWIPSGATVRALTFDQLEGQVQNSEPGTRWGTLYVAAHEENASRTIIYRVPVNDEGRLPSWRVVEPIAGGAVSSAVTNPIASNHARSLDFTIGWNALAFDLNSNGLADARVRLFVGDVDGKLYKLEQFDVGDNNNWLNPTASNDIFYPTSDTSPNSSTFSYQF
jgi:hypothetical protein